MDNEVMNMQYKIPRGTYDILPSDSWRWQKVINTFRATAQAFGYAEIVTPIFEQVELFERSSGESSDIVQKEMYRFEDKKGRTFALRPEGTASVVRSFAENHLEAQSKITKLYYIGPMFRYDRPQAGRFRQFYQYGMECIGSHHPFYDAEIIALQKSFLKALGLKQIELEINSVGCPNCSKDYDNALIKYFEPHREELCPDCQTRIKLKPRRLLDCKVAQCKAIAVNAPSMLDYLDEDCRSHFEQVKGYLNEMAIDFVVNPRIVRGLDYYTHTAFEFLNPALGAQNAISGGGRYNGLIKQIGGMDIPAVGIAGGFERLLLSLEKEGLILGEKPVPKAYLVTVGELAVKQGIKLLNTLRQQGISIAWDPEKESFKAQIKSADSCKADYAIIIGEDEVASGKLTIKDMKTGTQSQYSEAEACNLFI
jgi:histidyl-tRNA synthetase